MKNKYTLIIALMMPFVSAISDEYRSKINDGYDYYKNGEYEKAADNFKQAAVLKPDRALPLYDKGTALYKSNDYQGAAKEFGNINGKIDDKDIRSDSYYNMGNSFFKAGKYEDAIKSYVDALKLNPKDKDYKHNLETALIKKQIQQQQQQQKQDQNKDKNKEQNKQDQQKQEQQKQQKQDQQKKDQQQNQQDQKQNEQKDQQQQANGQEKKMSKEQAQRLLAQFAEDEKEIQKQLKQVNLRSRSRNDW